MNENIFDMVGVTINVYRNKYNKILSEKEKRANEINKNYKAGSELYIAEMGKCTDAFDSGINEERAKAKEFILDAVGKILEEENKKCSYITEKTKNTLSKLDMLSSMPISKEELQAISDTMPTDYWIDKKISLIAEKNGCKIERNVSDLAEKTAVLEELGNNFNKYIDLYDGSNSDYELENLVSDRNILNLENRYNNGYKINLSAEQSAKRAVANIKSQSNILEKATMLSNVMRNADESGKDALMYEIAKDERLNDVVKFAGKEIDSKISDFKETKLNDYKTAKDTLETALKDSTPEKASARIDEIKENQYVKPLIKELLLNNSKDDVRFMQEVCRLSEIEMIEKDKAE